MRLAICDGQWLFAAVLSAAFARHGHEVVLTTDDARQLLDDGVQPELFVVDSPATAARLRDLRPRPYVVLLADPQDDLVWDAYDRGTADGVVSKSCALLTLVDAVESVAGGNRVVAGRPVSERRRRAAVVEPLTSRELQVLRLVVQGHSTQWMADRLGVSTHTVRTHVQQVLRKLGVHARGKIAHAAASAGLVDVQELVADGHR
ncbi:DNA-binding NarL/FixJ family response regulator [Kribbella aluminosa]|uniref:DNA-binding NarL/FixJ family response regulator n=1 Tax=Kribbella aluminosa TaxID=416017 RepID=A0ABS4UVI9_9ACTN|nr:response regulator transcription factor [Kribbella aluminosa]MBP2355554.1 DNA-binding NarL/FixJ family response regulator [Kribbella aluminosa]